MKTMKIVYAVDAYHPRLNGVTTFIDSALKFLANQGHEVFLLCPTGYPGEDLYPSPLEGIATIYKFSSSSIWYSTNREDRLINPWENSRVNKTLDAIKPDLIHIHTEFNLGWVAKKYALRNDIPLVATAHTYHLPYSYAYFPYIPHWIINFVVPKLFRRFYHGMDITLTPTVEMQNILVETLKIDSPVRTCFIGIDTSDFDSIDREAERKESFYFGMFPRWRNRRRLLFVGRMGPEKNVELLFNVFEKVLAESPSTELIMVGSGSYIDQYQREVDSRGMGGNVTFTGAIPHNKLKDIYAIADIFTFPSLTETQGLVTVEALYCGLPVVAMNALGTKIVMEGSRGGFLVDNEKDFTQKTLDLLKDERLYSAKQQEALNRGRELTFAKTGKILLGTYEEVIAKHPKKKTSS